jgi:glutathione synthase/RimK-type ligase-like ATP-grasp enzyme
MRSVLTMMQNQYCLVEPFLDGAYDLRIQKIGHHLRAFRRVDISGEWKTNTGTSIMEEVPMEPRRSVWVDHVKSMFGGLDILTVEAIVENITDKEYILEVNGTSSGLHPDCAEEDNLYIQELVVDRLNAMYQPSEGI